MTPYIKREFSMLHNLHITRDSQLENQLAMSKQAFSDMMDAK